jgi:leader peptidase (prepilin peptidase)/N-methyltransferase
MTIFAFILGAAAGSFLNVCIHRLPQGESLLRPRSHCSACRRILGWHDMIPILSYLWLKGRCRYCEARIPLHHLVVEVLTAIVFAMLWQSHGLSWKFITTAMLSGVLLIIAFIDLYWLCIPNSLVLIGFFIAFIDLSPFALSPFLPFPLSPSHSLSHSPFLGFTTGALILWLPGKIGKAITGRESMGAGDIKLAAMLGFGLGWQGIVLVIWVACFIAAIYGLIGIGLGRLQRTSKIPLGFFVGLVAVGYVAAEHWLDNWVDGLVE